MEESPDEANTLSPPYMYNYTPHPRYQPVLKNIVDAWRVGCTATACVTRISVHNSNVPIQARGRTQLDTCLLFFMLTLG
jgi:hypothetical protein